MGSSRGNDRRLCVDGSQRHRRGGGERIRGPPTRHFSLLFAREARVWGILLAKEDRPGHRAPFADGGGVRTRRPAVRVLPGVLRPAQRDARHERADPRAEIIRRVRRIFRIHKRRGVRPRRRLPVHVPIPYVRIRREKK